MIENEAGVTDAVLAAMPGTPDARLRAIMAGFVKHMHAFAREVRLTEAEFERAIDFLNRIGQATNDHHNEVVLFSDASASRRWSACSTTARNGATETAAALLGPFWRANSPRTRERRLDRRARPRRGRRSFARCAVSRPAGRPLAGVEVDVWQSSPARPLREPGRHAGRHEPARQASRPTSRAASASAPSSPPAIRCPPTGPSASLLRAQLRHPYRPAHLHLLAFKPGYKTLITQVFVDDDEHLESDVVFGVTRHLIGDFRRHEGDAPEPGVEAPWFSLDYAFVMEPGEAVLPKPPIK